MDNKRFQVFVSSTYRDLIEPRARILESLFKEDYIPAGMEAFPSFDDDTFEYIKRVIDSSDYFVLVIAGRYGSMQNSEASFVEKEYRYALSKSLPVLCFLKRNTDDIANKFVEHDEALKKRLEELIVDIRSKRHVVEWDGPEDLALKVAQALHQAVKMKPGVGWIRGNVASSMQTLSELNEIRKENELLKKRLHTLESLEEVPLPQDIAPMSSHFVVRFKADNYNDDTTYPTIGFTWNELFKIGGHRFHTASVDDAFSSELVRFLKENRQWDFYSLKMFEDDLQTVMAQFVAYNLIGRLEDAGQSHLFQITRLGNKKLAELRMVKS